ncbi:MAG: DUF421 domain-containing protein [Planctomycetaceae bacterium]|nr:DUF421 domain-containing protein [Planctomycetaceae bacterium]
MPSWFDLDWSGMFIPSQPILETIIRGSATYLSLFVLLRAFRRQTGSIGPADLLVLLLIADASQNAMAGEYRAITDGLILVMTIVGWEYALDWLAFRYPAVAKWTERPALPLIEKGRVLKENLDSELLSVDELLSQLRQKGVDEIARVRRCLLEGDGHISVITDEASTPAQSRPADPASGA